MITTKKTVRKSWFNRFYNWTQVQPTHRHVVASKYFLVLKEPYFGCVHVHVLDTPIHNIHVYTEMERDVYYVLVYIGHMDI